MHCPYHLSKFNRTFQTVSIANKNSLRLCVITAMFSAVTLKTNKL